MDAPNALIPANPNAQDQFVGVVQGLAVQNQVQGPAVQNQAQGPAVPNPAQGAANQNQAQVPAGLIPAQGPAVQIPVQGPTQVGQNIPIQSCRSLVFSGTVHWFEGRQAFIHYCGLHQV